MVAYDMHRCPHIPPGHYTWVDHVGRHLIVTDCDLCFIPTSKHMNVRWLVVVRVDEELEAGEAENGGHQSIKPKRFGYFKDMDRNPMFSYERTSLTPGDRCPLEECPVV